MARTTLMNRLRRLARMHAWARREGIDDPAAIAAGFAELELTRRRTLQGAAALLVPAAACADDDSSAEDGAGSTGGDGSGTGVDDGGSSTGPGDDDGGSTGSSDGADETGTDSGGPEMPVIAIVGGGTAGLHCAYQLAQSGIVATVYEASARTGGRMYTAHGRFPDGQIAELGGELVDSGHTTMMMLADAFGLTLDNREPPEGIAADVWWIDGVAVPDATVMEQYAAVADLMADLAEMADTDDDVYAMLDETSLRDWLDDNVPPAMYPELHAILDNAYRGEYGLETDEQSVLNMLYLITTADDDEFHIFGASDELYHTHEGSQAYPDALAAALEDQILLEHALVSATDREGGGATLVFESPGGEVTVQADHVVFAVPFTRLRQVDLSRLTLSDDKRTIIEEVGYGTNAKLMGAFTERIWRTQYDSAGAVTTDRPFQQTWDTSIGQDGDHGILTLFLGGDTGLGSDRGSPEEVYTTLAVTGVEELWPGAADAYVDDSAIRMHWPTHPQTLGSYACYRPGQWAYYGIEGAREGNLHFCGEHTSLEFQGYMEGAAETGALVAAAILEELGAAPSRLLQDILAVKLAVPQPAISGRLGQRPRPRARRRAILTAHAHAMAARRR